MNPKINISVIFILAILFSACSKKETGTQNNNKDEKYIAYYFHPTARCEGCMNMEAYLQEIIDTKYSNAGFKFIGLNIEDAENEHYRKDYDLKYSSVILAKFDGENQIKWKNLDSVWSFTEDKEKFFRYAENEINNFINTNN